MFSFIGLKLGAISHISSDRGDHLWVELVELTELFETARQYKFDLHQILQLLLASKSWDEAVDDFRIDFVEGVHLLVEGRIIKNLRAAQELKFGDLVIDL